MFTKHRAQKGIDPITSATRVLVGLLISISPVFSNHMPRPPHLDRRLRLALSGTPALDQSFLTR